MPQNPYVKKQVRKLTDFGNLRVGLGGWSGDGESVTSIFNLNYFIHY